MTNDQYVRLYFRKKTGEQLDLDNPKGLSEKIQWLKLYYNNPLCTVCADKYAVRGYVESKGHGNILNKLIGVYDDPDQIALEQLPERFVIKATHGSSWNMICRDKSETARRWETWKKVMRRWLSLDYALYSRELHYTYIPPRLIVEEFLDDFNGREIRDYKFFCFHGEPRVVQVDYDRHTAHKRSYLDQDWNLIDVRETTLPEQNPPEPKPDNLEYMLSICRDLAADFIHVRVDLYLARGKVYLGELTFTDNSGYVTYDPRSFDRDMGDMLTLPDKSDKYVMLK